MRKLIALVAVLLLVATDAPAPAQVSGIAGYLLVGRSTVAAMPAAASVVRGLWIVTDDADCDASTADDGVTVCVDEGASWAALTAGEGGGGGAPDAHASTHQDGGSDEVSVAGLSGLLATAQTPAAHTQASTTISDSTAAGRTLLTAADASAQRTALALGTSAVLNVPAAGNAASGEVVKGNDTRLNDSRTPTSHASTHENAGADELSVAGLSGVLADPQTPATHSHTAAGDVDGDLATTDLDEAAVESELEAVLDLPDLQGAVTDAQVPNTITVDLAAAATTAAADGTDCSAGNYARGVDTSWNATNCTADDDSPDSDAEVPNDITVASSATIASAQCLQLASLTAGSAACICASSDRLYHDTDCDATKDAGEEFIDQAGGGSVPGANTQVIFNDGGVEAGDAGFTYNKTTDTPTIVGGLNLAGSYGFVADTTNFGSTNTLRLSDQSTGFKNLSVNWLCLKGAGSPMCIKASTGYAFRNHDDTAFYGIYAADIQASKDASQSNRLFAVRISGSRVGLSSDATFGFTSSTDAEGTLDATLTRGAAAVVKLNDALQLNPRSSPPVTCGAGSTEGVVYSDSDGSKALCWCTGAAWVVVAGAGACA